MITGYAMQLDAPGRALRAAARQFDLPQGHDLLIQVTACGICRTDLHVIDGEIEARYPVVPGHEVVGRVVAMGDKVDGFRMNDRVGVPWLGSTCRHCDFCRAEQENLCDQPVFTGATRDGGYASHLYADSRYCLRLSNGFGDVEAAPLLCAGLIGYRSLKMAGDGRRLGLYGFGAAAHIVAQVARWQGREVYAFTRPGDADGQRFARHLGCRWAGASDELPPEPIDAAIIFAAVGALVPTALRAVRKGGRVICAGIHMTDIPSFPYALLWGERSVASVANLTRKDGNEFLEVAVRAGVTTSTTAYPLSSANEAIGQVRRGAIEGAAVLVPDTTYHS